ncbi:hypothetical protein CEXT_393001 [Caerostris extrusa]|uniref:Uncharacterized protein n=1 Tax=Caerostris extrusa TaxID=172846 RepID=A0AAV4XYF0_CAEEX|nr:hypothetical protein CEXT_393001 [Caerostris extrusa]
MGLKANTGENKHRSVCQVIPFPLLSLNYSGPWIHFSKVLISMDPVPSLWGHCCFVHFTLHLNMGNVSFQMETKPLRIISRQSAGCLFPGKVKNKRYRIFWKGIDLCSSGTFR